MTADGLPELIVSDAHAWRSWLGEQRPGASGVWLVLAKKGTSTPTTLMYDAALDEALCHGWIDGQVARRDESTYRQRFTPRRPTSRWSQTNVRRVQRLTDAGRMTASGLAEVERARADGRWEMAYAGQATMEVPLDLADALRASPRAAAMFDVLTRQNRYAILFRVDGAKRAATRARRIEQFVTMLERGETPYPQRRAGPA